MERSNIINEDEINLNDRKDESDFDQTLKFKANPYFNKKELKTKHAQHLDNISLYQMGQVQ